jgi:probable HAF family extracellular repeat protein
MAYIMHQLQFAVLAIVDATACLPRPQQRVPPLRASRLDGRCIARGVEFELNWGVAMTRQKLTFGMLAVLFFSIITTFAQAPTVSVSKFNNVNAPGAIETDAYAVNSFKVIAGDYVDQNNVQHGMLLNGKTLTSVDRSGCQSTPGPGSIAFFGINNAKGPAVTVVGWCFDTNQKTDVAFLYSNGAFTAIQPPSSISTIAQGLNDKGEVVGAFLDTRNVQHAFLFTGTQYITLDVPNHTVPNAWSINSNGRISIFALNTKSLYDSFLFNGKSYTKVNVKGAVNNFIHAIDDSGDRVYTITDSNGDYHGVFFLAGPGSGFAEFEFPDATETQAFGLSDKLEIVGDYQKSADHSESSSSKGYSALGCCRPE